VKDQTWKTSFALVLSVVVALAAAPTRAGSCEKLAALKIPDVTIASATFIQPTSLQLFTTPDGTRPGATIAAAFCRVVGVATPTSDSHINFEVWLPPTERWNGKFQGEGNGGLTGGISYAAMATALESGYAAASSDLGHVGTAYDGSFAIGHPEKLVDYGYRADHITAMAGKAIVRAYYRTGPKHSFFVGCSNGGHQAFMEAERFPGDYDGIVGGAPAIDYVNIQAAFNWFAQAALKDAAGNLPQTKLSIITKAVLAECVGKDGGLATDAFLTNPAVCHFDPTILLCKPGHELDACLTAPQLNAVQKIYAGPSNPRTKEQIYPGEEVGSEAPQGLHPTILSNGWIAVTSGPKPAFGEIYSTVVYHDSNWDWRSFNFDSDLAYVNSKIAWMNSNNPDLNAFKTRGGKLISYQGWGDHLVLPQGIINYYQKVMALQAAGDQAHNGLLATQQFFRLFMVPGMGHCGAGPGPNVFDAVGALDQWVSRGIAPAKIIAIKYANDDPKAGVAMTRPLCVYPQIAKYNGSGSVDDAASFVCGNPPAKPANGSQ
jgi:feruloyl esterase